jgi:hypothetical protein
VAWLSRRQQIVATSSMEAEYIVHEIIWFRALLIGLELIDSGTPTTIIIDNTNARSLTYNLVHNSRSKHIDAGSASRWRQDIPHSSISSRPNNLPTFSHTFSQVTTSTNTPFGSCTIPTVPCFDTSYQTIAKRSTCVTQAGLAC